MTAIADAVETLIKRGVLEHSLAAAASAVRRGERCRTRHLHFSDIVKVVIEVRS